MSLSPYFVPHVPGLPAASLDRPALTPGAVRARQAGTVALVVAAAAALLGVLGVQVGVLSSGVLAAVLAVGFGLSLTSAVLVDVVVSVRRHRADDDAVRPGLRAASFFYLAALLCLGVTFAFLAV